MNYIIFNKAHKMLRIVQCPQILSLLQVKEGEFIIEGKANDATQKIEFDGLDEEDQPINPRVIDKTPAEIEADNPTPPEIPESQRPARITNKQWQDVLDKITNLEKK